jgi:hypothetical protein
VWEREGWVTGARSLAGAGDRPHSQSRRAQATEQQQARQAFERANGPAHPFVRASEGCRCCNEQAVRKPQWRAAKS